jgi:hypothetical protein
LRIFSFFFFLESATKSALKRKSPDRELEIAHKGKKDLRVSEHDAQENWGDSPKELLVSQHGNVLVLKNLGQWMKNL